MSERSERGFALAGALIVALLFFAIVAAVLMESTTALRSAQFFRARLASQALAESGAEVAAASMQTHGSQAVETETSEGRISGEYRLVATEDPDVMQFTITGRGTTTGTPEATATVYVYGRLWSNGAIRVEQTRHEQ